MTTLHDTAHARGVRGIESELSALHRAMLRRRGDDDAAVVRLSVFTLVVACNDESVVEEAERVVEHITLTHPARALLLVADPHAPAGIEADFSLQCSVLGGGQVCGEHVRLRIGGEAALHLVSVVTPLLLPDVPVVLWLAGAPPLQQALTADALALCNRLVLDTAAYPDPAAALRELLTASRAGNDRPPPLSDLAWERGRPWRRAIAAAFDAREMRPYLADIGRLRITSRGARPAAEALLLAGWLADRLGWSHGGPGVVLDTDPAAGGAGIAALELHAAAPGGGEVVVRAHRDAGALLCTVTAAPGMPPRAQRIPLDERDPADLVGAVLQQVEADRLYAQALPHAVAMAGRS